LSYSSSDSQQAVFPARLASLPGATAFAQSFCAQHAVSRDDALRLTLIIEELFTNTVTHGYGADCDAEVTLVLTVLDDSVRLLYEDKAPRFDPLARSLATGTHDVQPLEARSVGGLGVRLVSELAAASRYAYEDGKNRVWITLKRETGAPRA